MVITPFDEDVKQISEQTAYIRNKTILMLADEVFIAYAQEGGQIQKLVKELNINSISCTN